MPERLCCAECFGDIGLQNDIVPTLSEIVGDCTYCMAQGVSLVSPAALAPFFELLIDAYDPDPAGRPLVECLREDWGLFTSAVMDDTHANELLTEILDDGGIVRMPLAPTTQFDSRSLKQWDDLRDEMMHRNRWFLDESIDLERLRQLLDLLIAPPGGLGTTWYRARLLADTKPFPAEEMGPPPPHLAGHGRANPAGIPYLYLGSTEGTAVSEVRPHTGDLACVAEFTVPSLRVVDLRNPRTQVSPFILSDSSEISQLRADLPLLERLGEELTRPVLPRGAAFEYTPSQYLCEFIKTRGFDGVIYRSSIGDGINLALFDPTLATVGIVGVRRIEKVVVQSVMVNANVQLTHRPSDSVH